MIPAADVRFAEFTLARTATVPEASRRNVRRSESRRVLSRPETINIPFQISSSKKSVSTFLISYVEAMDTPTPWSIM